MGIKGKIRMMIVVCRIYSSFCRRRFGRYPPFLKESLIIFFTRKKKK